MMKTKLMVMVVVAGLLTAGYRFLPSDLRYKLDAQLDDIRNTQVAETKTTEKKKYVLQTSDPKSTIYQNACRKRLHSAFGKCAGAR